MKIGINAQFVNQPYTGMGMVIREVLKILNQKDQSNKYILYFDQLIKPEDEKSFFNLHLNPQKFSLKIIPCKFGQPRSLRNKIIWEKYIIPKKIKTDNLDLFFSPYATTTILKKIPHIIAVYDLQHRVIPVKGFNKDYLGHFFFYLTEKAIKKASNIVTISENSKKEIIKLLNIPSSKITNISCGKSEIMKPFDVNQNKELWQDLARKLKITKPYFLYTGSLDPRKNVTTLIKAFASFLKQSKNKDIKLILVGKSDLTQKDLIGDFTNVPVLAKELNIQDNIKQVGFVSELEKAILFNNAEIFVFPSLYEGFGIPPLEALTCGCPVISSNNSSLPEVIGNAGILINNPLNSDELAAELIKLSADENLKKELKEKGLKQSQKFSWEKTTDILLKVFEDIAEGI